MAQPERRQRLMGGGFIAWTAVAFVICFGAERNLWGTGPVIAAFAAALILSEQAFIREE